MVPVSSNLSTAAWQVTLVTDWSHWNAEGHVDVHAHIDGQDAVGFVYAFAWQQPDGSSFWGSGYIRDSTFYFYPPFGGQYIVTCTCKSPDGKTLTADTTLEIRSDTRRNSAQGSRSSNDEISGPPAIVVNDVSMVFNIASEQYNSLKEYFIALMRHELRFKAFRALDHISFTVRRGEAFGLVGSNGSGKSTMLKIIAGVLDATEGTHSVRGYVAPPYRTGRWL